MYMFFSEQQFNLLLLLEDSFSCHQTPRAVSVGKKSFWKSTVSTLRQRATKSQHFAFSRIRTEYGEIRSIQSKCGEMRTRITPNTDTFHAVVFKLLRGTLGNIRDKSIRNLISELRFLLKHVDKKHNEVVFAKCFDLSGHHCIGNPSKSDQFKTFLKIFNSRLPKPSFFHRSDWTI